MVVATVTIVKVLLKTQMWYFRYYSNIHNCGQMVVATVTIAIVLLKTQMC